MARLFAKVSEEEIEEAFFYQSDLINTKASIPLRVGEERWIYTSTPRVSVYIHHYSPPLQGIVVYYFAFFVLFVFHLQFSIALFVILYQLSNSNYIVSRNDDSKISHI